MKAANSRSTAKIEASKETLNEKINATKSSKKEFKMDSLRNFIKETVVQSVDGILIGGIGINDWERTGWALPIIMFYYAVFVMSFFYFLYTFALAGINSTFLSLTSTDEFQLCAEIPVTLRTSFQVISNVTIFCNSDLFLE
jgi:hypothetical protein